MERQRHVCVIDWFGVNYDGTMGWGIWRRDRKESKPILVACEQNGRQAL